MARARSTAVAALAVLALGVAWAAPADAAGDRTVLASSAAPLQIAVGHDGTVYVAQDAAGVLTAVDRKGTATDIAKVEGSNPEIAGVDVSKDGAVVYTATTSTGSEETGLTWLTGTLNRVLPDGRHRQVADMLGYEQRANPDKNNTYGLAGASADCVAGLPEEVQQMLASYKGLVDSHAYAVLQMPDGSRIVADAGGNDLVKVQDGHVNRIAVFPGVPTVITAEIAAQNGVPDCLVGATYTSEAVPTDVELGPDGMLYVTTLSGGIAPGALWKVDPSSSAITQIASGFAGAVNLAVRPNGTVYVSELFGGRIAKVRNGVVTTAREVAFPGGLEFARGKLFVGTDVFATGKVISFVP